MEKRFTLPEMGLEVEIGKLARQANGAAWLKAGNNVVLSTAVASSEARESLGFFPLTVEYRERTAAAGKIPGGFFKREGKLSDVEVLTSRLIDRPIRPLFPVNYFNEVQILSTVYSSDGKFPLTVLSMLASSIALTVSDIPFLGPIGAAQIGRVDGAWKFNISYEESLESDAIITVAGTQAGICMVEGHCNDLGEAELIDLLFKAHELIKKQVAWQLDIQRELGVVKKQVTNTIDLDVWGQKVAAITPEEVFECYFASNKQERKAAIKALETNVVKNFAAEIAAEEISAGIITYLFETRLKKVIADIIGRKQHRTDGRALDQVRPIYSEVGLLPCVHGSAVFQRGETQALASLTLGSGQDAQKVESLMGGLYEKSFMLHYNFPPFATGEVKPMRATGRREIGHGYLAETSFHNVLPTPQDFPYTIRSVVDVLESNGSSSMATVCSTTLALMDAGVPITQMVSGIAMGLVVDSAGTAHVLTDILGEEDGFGLMDFKVTGTDNGIMAFQLDIKDKVGLTKSLFEKALAQARTARLHILGEMRKVLDKPRAEISSLAPQIFSMKVPQDKIGAIIGPAGSIIKEIQSTTQSQINIEDDGTVLIFAKNAESAKEAESWIRRLTKEVEVGATYTGTVRKIAEFGLFVEIIPGKDGLVHISTIAKNKQRNLEDYVKTYDKIEVQVVAVDSDTGRVRLICPSLEKAD